MPANFTAVNSEVVYGGADLFSILADTTAPVWNAANVKKFNTNVITLISNSFFTKTVDNTLGVMFGGNWGKDNDHIFGEAGSLNQNVFGLWDNTDPANPVRTDDMTFGPGHGFCRLHPGHHRCQGQLQRRRHGHFLISNL